MLKVIRPLIPHKPPEAEGELAGRQKPERRVELGQLLILAAALGPPVVAVILLSLHFWWALRGVIAGIMSLGFSFILGGILGSALWRYRVQTHQKLEEQSAKLQDFEKFYQETTSRLKDSEVERSQVATQLEDLKRHLADERELREQVQKELKQVQARHRSLLEALPGIVMEVDNNRVYTWANDGGKRFFGPDCIGREAAEYFVGRQRTYDIVQTLFEGDTSTVYGESLQQRCDGKARLLAWQCRALRDENGQVIGAISFAQDITEMRETEIRLRESEECLRKMATAAQDAIIMIDGGGTIVFWNPAAERIFGYTPAEAIGRDAHELLCPPELLPAFEKGFEYFCQTGRGAAVGRTLELEALHKDGRRIPIELSLASFEQCGQWHAVAVIRDLAERKKAERALRESEERYRIITESVKDIIWSLDLELRFTYVNSAVEALLGYRPEELLGQSAEMILSPESTALAWAKLKETLPRVLAGDRPVESFELEHRTKSGESRWFQIRASFLLDEMGQPVGILGIARDTTERRLGEQERERHLREQKLINHLLGLSLEEGPLPEQLKRVINALVQSGLLPPGAMVSIFLTDGEDGNRLRLETFVNRADDGGGCMEILLGECNCGRAAQERRPIISTGLNTPYLQLLGQRLTQGVGDIWQFSIPLMDGAGKPWGVLCLACELPQTEVESVKNWVLTVADLLANLIKRKTLERQLAKQTQVLSYRVRELGALYEVGQLVSSAWNSPNEIAPKILEVVAGACRFPELVGARLLLYGSVVAERNYQETVWKMASPVMLGNHLIGALEVCYVSEPPVNESTLKSFIREEQQLLDSVADRLGSLIKYKQAEAEIRKLKQQLEFILGATSTGLVIADHKGQLLYVDPRSEKIYGPYAGRSCCQYFWGNDPPQGRCVFSEALHSGKTAIAEEVLPKEQNRVVQITASPFADEKGCWFVAAVIADITRIKQLEEECARAQRLEGLGRLAGGVAHELNTPIQFVNDNLNFLRNNIDELSALLERLEEMVNLGVGDADLTAFQKLAAEASTALEKSEWEYLRSEIPRALIETEQGVARIAGIVQAMRQFAESRSGGCEWVDLNRLIEATLTLCRSRWEPVATLVTEFEDDLPKICASGCEINQALFEIIFNAAEAVAEGPSEGEGQKGIIRIETRSVENGVEIVVADNGPGIPLEIQSKIFDPFFTTKGLKHVGKGLTLADSIVRSHGGFIRCESRVGQGSTFRIFLPQKLAVHHRPEEEPSYDAATSAACG